MPKSLLRIVFIFLSTSFTLSLPLSLAAPLFDLCGSGAYDTWLANYGTDGSNGGDFNGDGTVNGVDYVIWLNAQANCGQGGSQPPPAQPPVDNMSDAWAENPDFPNIEAYCQSLGYQGMRVVDATAGIYGVYCVRNGTEIASIDMNTVCPSLYGAGSTAVITNAGSSYGWNCALDGNNGTGETNPTTDPTTGDTSSVPQITGSSSPQWEFSIQPTGRNVNIRSGPGTDNRVIAQTSSGYFESIGLQNGWFHIRFEGGDGWISFDFVAPPPNADNSNTGSTSDVLDTTPVPIPIGETTPPATCPSGTGPGGIAAGGYNPEKLTQEQRQWLFTTFGNTGTAAVGYGGQACGTIYGSGDENFRAFVCQRADSGPGGILPGGYDPQSLTQDQRQWLFTQFGNQGTAPVGYGGESCPVAPVPQCPSGVGPNGIVAGGYTPQDLTQDQRQWLWDRFGQTGIAPVGYGGQSCSGGATSVPACPAGVGEPGGYDPTTLSQQQRNDLFIAFGHTGEAPIGYGGEACYGGTMTLPSFIGSTSSPGQTDTTNDSTSGDVSSSHLPVDQGMPLAVWTNSAYVTEPTGVNIRAGADIQYDVVGLAGFHGYFEVISGPENGWYKIRFGSGEGWISSQYVEIKSSIDTSGEISNEPSFVCRAVLVNIYQNNANGVISGALSGLDGCKATIEIKNERPYWVNFQVSTVGNDVTLEAAGGSGNFFAENRVLPPKGTVLYQVTFTQRGQTVTALVDATTVSGSAARRMNLIQATVDAISTVTQLPVGTAVQFGYEVYPDIYQTMQSMEHLRNASNMLLTNPTNVAYISNEFELAWQAGEFERLDDELEKLGWIGLKERFPQLAGENAARFAGLADTIIRNYSSALEIIITGQVAGFIIFEAS